MPLSIVDIDWLNKFSDKGEQLLSDYKQSLDKVETFNPIMHPLWSLMEPEKNIEHFPTLKGLLDGMPDDVFLSLVTFASITPGMIGHFHNEPYPRHLGFRRYHVVLQTEPTAQFEIEGEGMTTWVVGKVYEFENPETMHRIYYPEGKDERIVMLIDVFVEGKPTEEALKLTYDIANGFVGREG